MKMNEIGLIGGMRPWWSPGIRQCSLKQESFFNQMPTVWNLLELGGW